MEAQTYGKRYNEINKDVLLDITAKNRGENVLISPLSTILILAMAAEATAGETRDEITDYLLSSGKYDELKSVLRELQEIMTKDGSTTISNAVIVKNSISNTINGEYTDVLRKYFGGRLFSSSNMVSDVNAWVKENTKGMIDRIADNSMKDMALAMLSALTFEAEWEEPYGDDDIEDREFTDSDGTVHTVPMLKSTESFYIEDRYCKGFVKEYRDAGFSYMAMLPKSGRGKGVPDELIRDSKVSELFMEKRLASVSVRLPEYTVSSSYGMEEFMKEKGIESIFSTSADFSPLSNEWLVLENALQKAYIQVNRNGTKAAAAHLFSVFVGCCEPTRIERHKVYLDRPFMYSIIHNGTCYPIFTGIVNNMKDPQSIPG